MPQAQVQTAKKEVVFDERGETMEADAPLEAAPAAEEPEAAEEAPETPAVPEQPNGGARYRLGDKYFATQEEALAYAQSQQEIADAYQQGAMDAGRAIAPQAPVSPPAGPKYNAEELYTNPDEFLARYAKQIKEEALTEVQAGMSQQARDNQVWSEFVQRHPMLADYRNEVESMAAKETKVVQGLYRTKGPHVAYDYVATKVKAQFEQYGQVVKPVRALPNGGTAAAPAGKAPGVTPKAEPKKAVPIYEQLRSIKAKQR